MSENPLEDKIRELEEEVKKLKDEQKEKSGKGVTQGALRGLGKIIPGFGDLVEGLQNSEAFQERLQEADAVIEHQIKHASPLTHSSGARQSSIPPKTTLKGTSTPIKKEKETAPPQREIPVDVFDEGQHVKIVAELPGVDEKDIQILIKDGRLILTVKRGTCSSSKDIPLPCAVKESLNSVYRNGILQITLDKA